MRIVDTKGQLCPAPLIAAKKELKETASGESFLLLTDNLTSFDNLSRFLKDNSAVFKVSESGGVWTMIITKTAGEVVQTNAEEHSNSEISHFKKGNFVVVIASDKMGEGDDQLGHLLMTNFIKALKDLDELPQKMVFYNTGVLLATASCPAVEHLRDLEKMGVEIMLCGTCVNYYSIESALGAGTVSNMYSIAEAMTIAGRVVRP